MTDQDPNWLSTQDFAKRIGASVEFVRRRLDAGVIPHQRAENNGSRLISFCHIGKFKPYSDGAQIFSVEEVTARTGLSKQTVCDLLKKAFNTLCYDPDHPPSIMECKKGMLVIFPDGESGLIRQTRQNAYQPAIEVFRKDEQESYLYAAAK